jgi:tRNA threonylcarbamoyladenosine biosynthesis protein TsaE
MTDRAERRAAGTRAAVILESDSPAATERIGERLAAGLVDGDVVCLTGELGAGKTCFVRGVLRGLDAPPVAQSPSFVVERRSQGRLVIHHLDLYRIEGRAPIQDLGIPDRFDEGGVFLIEWGERAAELLPEGRIDVVIDDLGDEARRLRISGPARALAALDAAAEGAHG